MFSHDRFVDRKILACLQVAEIRRDSNLCSFSVPSSSSSAPAAAAAAAAAASSSSAGLGISLEGTVDVERGREVRPHHYIRSILPGSPVDREGSLATGDELLEVQNAY